MRPTELVALLGTALCVGGSPAQAGEPPAPAPPAEIVAYHDSGEWAADTERVAARARDFLGAQAAGGPPRRPAIVLDVDDTALSNFACLRRVDFVAGAREGCALAADMPAIAPVLELHRFARERGAAVFFITGRRERLRHVTERNLRAAGYTGYRRLIMRPDRERPGTHDGFKARMRKRLTRRGYRIVVNVGDQRSDLTGGFAQRTFKLPNPMYVIERA